MKQKALALLVLFVTLSLDASNLTLDFFKDKPRSHLKDFYISQFLNQPSTTPEKAKALIGEVNNMNTKMFYKFADKMDDFTFKRVKYCKKLPASKYIGVSADCVVMGLSNYGATKLPKDQLLQIAKRVKYQFPSRSKEYNLIAQKSFDKLMKSSPKMFIRIFTTVGGKERETYYNKPIPAEFLNKLTKLPSFSSMVKKIVRNDKLVNLQKSIIKIDSSKLSAEANFLLALNAIKYNEDGVAVWYLEQSHKKAYLKIDKDKALFWQYLLTKNLQLLPILADSHDINIYSLYAFEKLGTFPQNIITSIEPKVQNPPFNPSTPFEWLKFKQKIKARKFKNYEEKRVWLMQYNSYESEPHIAKLLYRFKNKKNYFLKPYYKDLKNFPIKRQILMLSLIRQESRFIPTAVSYSHALGIMQFMPFLAKNIANKLDLKNFKPEHMFDPKTSYIFGNYHLNFLEKRLNHPLYIAYAYNGGIGFTKRKILNKYFFKTQKYEPYLSLERVPNEQAREYGKKVLANYVVYSHIYGQNESLSSLLEKL